MDYKYECGGCGEKHSDDDHVCRRAVPSSGSAHGSTANNYLTSCDACGRFAKAPGPHHDYVLYEKDGEKMMLCPECLNEAEPELI